MKSLLNKKLFYYAKILSFCILLPSCSVSEKDSEIQNSFEDASISTVTFSVDRFSVTGKNLALVTAIKISGNGLESDLTLSSKTNTSLQAVLTENLLLALSKTYNLVFTTAFAQTIVTIDIDASATTFTNFTSTGIDDNASSTAITIDSSQNIGIGTTSPSSTLDVNGTITSTAYNLNSTTSSVSDATDITISTEAFSVTPGTVDTTDTTYIAKSTTVTVPTTATGVNSQELDITGSLLTVSHEGDVIVENLRGLNTVVATTENQSRGGLGSDTDALDSMTGNLTTVTHAGSGSISNVYAFSGSAFLRPADSITDNSSNAEVIGGNFNSFIQTDGTNSSTRSATVTGDITGVYGSGQLRGLGENGTVTSTNVYGVNSFTRLLGTKATSTVSATNVYGMKTDLQVSTSNGASVTATNVYGVHLSTSTTGSNGTVTNLYGIYLEDLDLSASGDNFGIYQSGATDSNYFAGNVGVATTDPEVALHVNGGLCVTSDDDCANDPAAGVVAAEAAFATNADLAEFIPIKDSSIQAGDLIAVDRLGYDSFKKANQKSKVIVGVISSRPGLVMGSETPDSLPLALSGRVPVNVNLEGGAIQAGDYLSAAKEAGKAKKAKLDGSEQIIGVALSNYNGNPVVHRKINDPIAREYGHQVFTFINLQTNTAVKTITKMQNEIQELKSELATIKALLRSKKIL